MSSNKHQKTELAVKPSIQTAPAVAEDVDFSAEIAADAGKGLEHIDADSVAIPFLAILQSGSPQVDPDSGEYIEGAKAGMFYNTVTREVFDGKAGVLIVPCEYQRKFLRWSPRDAGGGFKGEIKTEDVAKMRARGELVELENRLYVPDEGGSINPKKNDKVSDTRVHYILLLNPNTGAAQQAVLSLGSTQIKKSKQLIALLGSRIITDPATGQQATPATFANLVRVTTVPESNDQGKWSGVKFELEGFVRDSATYRMGRAFHTMVNAGRAAANFTAEQEAPAGGGRAAPRRAAESMNMEDDVPF